MRDDPQFADGPAFHLADGAALMTTGAVSAPAPGDAALALRRFAPLGAWLRVLRSRSSLGSRAGHAALAAIVLGVFAVVVVADAGPSSLVRVSGSLVSAL